MKSKSSILNQYTLLVFGTWLLQYQIRYVAELNGRTVTIGLNLNRSDYVINTEELNRLAFEKDIFPEPSIAVEVQSDFPFSVGEIVRHHLNDQRGMVIEVKDNKATVRIYDGNDWAILENVSAVELRKSY